MKSSYQTALKVASIIMIVFGCIGAISAIGLLAFTPLAASTITDTGADAEFMSSYGALFTEMGITEFTDALMYMWTLALINSIFFIVVGIFGIRGANDPSKIVPFRNLSIFLLCYTVFQIIADFVNMGMAGALTPTIVASTISSSVFSIVFAAICVWVAYKVQNLNNRPTD